MKLSLITVASLISLTSAHFVFTYPPSRPGDIEQESTSPCGPGTSETTNRTQVNPLQVPIVVNNHHATNNIFYNMCLGEGCWNSSDTAFNITINQPLSVTGLGDFCIPDVVFPDDYENGTLATIQLIEQSPDGTLYACADIIFIDDAPTTDSSCDNNTNVAASPISSSSASASASATSAATTTAAAAATTSSNSAMGLSYSIVTLAAILFSSMIVLV